MFHVTPGAIPPLGRYLAKLGPGIGKDSGQQRGTGAAGADDEESSTRLGEGGWLLGEQRSFRHRMSLEE